VNEDQYLVFTIFFRLISLSYFIDSKKRGGMSMSEKLLQEIKEELRKSNSILSKILKGLEEYIEFRKKQSR